MFGCSFPDKFYDGADALTQSYLPAVCPSRPVFRHLDEWHLRPSRGSETAKKCHNIALTWLEFNKQCS